MNRFIPVIGVMGIGVAATGGYLFSSFSQDRTEETGVEKVSSVKFREKYGKFLLSVDGVKDSLVWENKLLLLKKGNPQHPLLKEASSKEDKSLLQKGCQSIYDAPYENVDYSEDFKNYCARLVEDTVAFSWIGDQDDGSSYWSNALKTLKGKQDNQIPEELKGLWETLTSETDEFPEDKIRILKDWCYVNRKSFSSGEAILPIASELGIYCVS